ncbi:MAG: site-specific integrase [Bacteroidia bacterium]|nr:site-specific integrase [Bacteroidia bacterium]
MASTNYYLDKKNSEKPTYIILSISDQGRRYRVSTGEKILPSYWNDKKQIVKRTYTGSPELNAFLKKFAEAGLGILREEKTEGRTITNQDLKTRLNKFFLPEEDKQVEDFSFWSVWEMFIQDSISKGRKPGTLRTYNTLYSRLTRFEASTHFNLTFENLDGRFKELFDYFLLEELELEHSTVQKTFKILRRYLNYAWRLGHNPHIEYQKWELEKEKTKVPIALRQSELDQLAEYDFSQSSRLEKARDLFVFQCETGMRVGDLLKLKRENITAYKGHTLLTYFAEKTGEHIEVPIDLERFPYSVKILEKYSVEGRENCFPRISQQKYRDYLKEVSKIAGLDRETTTTKNIKGKAIQERKHLHQIIATHTARRTFISLSHEAGMPISWIILYTGQKSYHMVLKYLEMHRDHKLNLALNPTPTRVGKPKMKKVI